MHISGQQLDQYTGIAAILRFPVYPDEPNVTAEEQAPSTRLPIDDSSDDDNEISRMCADGVASMNIFSFA